MTTPNEPDEELQESIQRAAAIMRASRYVVSLIGAGISAESGLPLYRGPEGMWTRLGAEPSNDAYQRFLDNPNEWWRQRQGGGEGRRLNWDEAKPNPAHYALVDLEEMGMMRHIVTQNVDNLHIVAGSRSISEIHGNRMKLRCINCNTRWFRDEFETSPNFIPTCPHCSGIVKGDTVMRGEPIPRDALARSFDEAAQADCCLIIGTTAVIYPAAEVPMIVRRNGGSLIEINPMDTRLSEYCDVILRGAAGEIMPALVNALRQPDPES